ncbi:MAG: hypothetical protein ABGX04_12805 [Myxococcales bacterium]|nr:hypothetical protein [Myxococcales bacterium]HIK84903.1 hypothetical protein [Myxococcales bacterium]
MLRRLIVLLVSVFVTGCLGAAGSLAPCDSESNHAAICGLTNPEDMGFLPDPEWIVVSEMAPNEQADQSGESVTPSGRLTAIRLSDLKRRSLFPTDRSAPDAPEMASQPASGDPVSWGDPSCPGEPDPMKFQPHGIDVGVGETGRASVAVVNHGSREAIELFEIVDMDGPALVWRGCVPMIPNRSANDVAWLPGGAFVVTNFMPLLDRVSMKAIWTLLKIGFGAKTGSVLAWAPGERLQEIENSEGSAPNGVEASADGTSLFVAEWGGESVYRLRLVGDGPPQRDEVSLEQNPDNLTWMRDGRLLVAGQHGGVSASMSCASIQNAGCDIGYSVYVIDPDALTASRLFEGRGAASVALEISRDDAGEIFVGFFIGDQIERVSRAD